MTHSSFGGPGLSRSQITRITNVGGLPLYVRNEVSPLFQSLINQLHGCRNPGAPALSSDGGYVKRFISGTTKWSNHSWGTAVDLNAATNPYKKGALVTDFQITKTRNLASSLGMRWGADYSVKKDAMHFEYMDSLSNVSKYVGKASSSVGTAFGIGSKGDKVKDIELRLDLLKFKPGTPEGVFDERTAEALKAFQKTLFPNDPKEWDGYAGPRTIKGLEFAPLPLGKQSDRRLTDTLSSGDTMKPGDMLVSKNGLFTLAMQIDGNVVLYGPKGVIWATLLRGTHLAMQSDGNLVLYIASGGYESAVWHTNTSGSKSAYLAVQDDGNVVVYSTAGKALWHIR